MRNRSYPLTTWLVQTGACPSCWQSSKTLTLKVFLSVVYDREGVPFIISRTQPIYQKKTISAKLNLFIKKKTISAKLNLFNKKKTISAKLNLFIKKKLSQQNSTYLSKKLSQQNSTYLSKKTISAKLNLFIKKNYLSKTYNETFSHKYSGA